jgi:hypothetical protein
MAVEVPLDVDLLKREIKKTCASLSQGPETGNLVATYMRSKFEDTRQKAIKFGANGSTVNAYKP